MLSFNVRVSAFAVILSVLATVGAPLCAAMQADKPCLETGHSCCPVARLMGCECGKDGNPARDGAPVPASVQVHPDLTVASAPSGLTAPPPATVLPAPVQTSPPYRAGCDLLTLYSTLQI